VKRFESWRRSRRLSQRALARKAGVAYRTIQLIEAGRHDPRLSTLAKLARALGERADAVERAIEHRLTPSSDTASGACRGILRDGTEAWKSRLFDFVDAFRRRPSAAAVAEPPPPQTAPKILALVAGVVEALCEEAGLPTPWWCDGVPALQEPWFVSGVENLTVSALVESPVHFRRRNVFVLANFLHRA
jgi:transcriptional regulator with XRE-family HTH domain